MRYDEIQAYFNHHCRIKLRSGKEVFGVLWEEMNETERAIYFASNVEHKKLMSRRKSNHQGQATGQLKVTSEDILGIEPL